MASGVNMAISISTTLNIVISKLRLPNIPTIVYTDSLLLYEYIIKLGTTREKRLIIDIIAIQQSYKRQELSKVRWINRDSNPVDAITKANLNKALKRLVNTNRLTVKVQG
jgi:hypothetical protein